MRVLFRKECVILAYLFGSQARKTAGPMSDADFAIVFDSAAPAREYGRREFNIAREAGKIINIRRVDVVNLLTAKSPLLKYNAVFGGIAIYVKNERMRFTLERKIMQEFEDTEYLRNIQFSLLRRRIKKGNLGKAPLLQKKYINHYVAN